MKKNKLAYLLFGVMLISGCKLTPSSSTVTPSTGDSSTTPSSVETPSSPTESSSTGDPTPEDPADPTPEDPSDPEDPVDPTPGIEHLDALVSDIENPSKTREYKSDYDEMLDDFSTTGNVDSTLRVLVDSAPGRNFPDTPDGAIYKVAGQYGIESYEGIGFRIRKVGEGTLDYSNLILALRGDDAFNTYPISLQDAVNTDAEELPELTDEYQDIVIAPGLTI